MSRSFLFGVLIDVCRNVVQSDAVCEGTSVTSDSAAANLEEARAKAGVAPNVASTATTARLDINFFMDVPPLSFERFPFFGSLLCVSCSLHFPGGVTSHTRHPPSVRRLVAHLLSASHR